MSERMSPAGINSMYSYEQKCIMDLSDNYTMLYAFIADSLIRSFKTEGERSVREALRRYGRDRGLCSRERHLRAGYKINMKNLFSVMFDLPPDPRFERELQELNEEERVSHTLICPMADIWKRYGMRTIGRIYCEEFHPACYNHYAYDCAVTGLAKTLTQECDDYCDFNVVLRKANVPEELLPVCFEEFDPGYIRPDHAESEADGRRGFEILCIKIYYYLLQTAVELLGDSGARSVGQGLAAAGRDGRHRAERTAAEYGKSVKDAICDTYPVSVDRFDESLWKNYHDIDAQKLIMEYLVPELSV